ncbi:hypothetical protein FSP39_002480 [Pinctada imbricata]|uniref:Uncharacterized protein n=1 Tax=Pinctada imbricata TaxID=66713 RepID=A0AA89BLN3_PINIB|nr:hypothetical protein FSP39_002480 [Pinctada imbricata]
MSRKSFCGQDIPEEDLPIASPVSMCKTIMLNDLGMKNPEFMYFPEGTNLFRLKTTAVKMKLQTRRPSYLEWKEKYVTRREIQNIGEEAKEQFHSEFSAENIDKINSALSWMKNELSLRLEWSCQQHQQMLEDAKSDLEEMREIKRVSDLTSE